MGSEFFRFGLQTLKILALFPASGPATGSLNGLHPKANSWQSTEYENNTYITHSGGVEPFERHG
jgi:hypothetical protein